MDSIDFRQVVVRGRSKTTLTPRYHDLSVESADEGGGVIGSVKRGVVKFVANTFKVHDENPTDDGKQRAGGERDRALRPHQVLVPGHLASGCGKGSS